MASLSTQLMDLPPELLHEICIGLDTKTLLRLSQMCRRLFDIAQPVIFKHQIARLQHLVDSGDLTTKPTRKMKSLLGSRNVPFDVVQLNLSNFSSWKILHSCYGLFSRMDYVGHIELHLLFCQNSRSSELPAPAPGWFQLAAVMNAIVGKSGSILTVTGGAGVRDSWPFTYTLTPKATGSADSPVAASPHLDNTSNSFPIIRQFLQLFASIRTKFSTSKSRPAEDPAAPVDTPVFQMVHKIKTSLHDIPRHPSPLLHALHINGNQLFHLPFFSWTLDTINKAPITCLSFQKTELQHDDWAYVLRNITIPTLSELFLGSSHVAFPDLQLFLGRHPSISILNLMGGTAIGRLVPYSSERLLPRLVEFAGDPEYVEHFLQPLEAHPDLNFITMSSEFGIIAFEYRYSRFDNVLELIAQRKQTMTLVLLLQSEAGLLKWLHSSTSPVVKQLVRLEIRIEGRFFLSTTIKRAICDWIERFPSLLHFKINAGFDVSGGSLDINALLWDRYKQLETIEYGGKIYRRLP